MAEDELPVPPDTQPAPAGSSQPSTLQGWSAFVHAATSGLNEDLRQAGTIHAATGRLLAEAGLG